MHPESTRRRAFELRQAGRCYLDIATELGVSERSVMRWIPDDPLSEDDRQAARRAIAVAALPPQAPGIIWVKDGETFVKAQVDPEDWHRFRDLLFQLSGKRYATTTVDGRQEYLHRMIMGLAPDERWPDGQRKVIDHINRDCLDCRKANMWICTQKDNCANRGGRFEKHDGPSISRTAT